MRCGFHGPRQDMAGVPVVNLCAQGSARVRLSKVVAPAAAREPVAERTGRVGPASSDTGAAAGLRELSCGLLWSFTSQQRGLGNVADPAPLELADGTLRLFFKNGNEPQLGLNGFDNAIHSFVSSDGQGRAGSTPVIRPVRSCDPSSLNVLVGRSDSRALGRAASGDRSGARRTTSRPG